MWVPWIGYGSGTRRASNSTKLTINITSKGAHSTFLETWTAVKAVKWAMLKFGRPVLVVSDCVTAISAVNRLSSGSRRIDEQCSTLAELCREHKLPARACYRPGSIIEADPVSRFRDSEASEELRQYLSGLIGEQVCLVQKVRLGRACVLVPNAAELPGIVEDLHHFVTRNGKTRAYILVPTEWKSSAFPGLRAFPHVVARSNGDDAFTHQPFRILCHVRLRR